MENKAVDYSKLKTFTLEQAADHLQYSVKTIKRMIRKGKFAPVIKPLGQIRIIAEDFYTWLDEQKIEAKNIYTPSGTSRNRRKN